MYVCMYVCMCVYIYIYIYTHVYTTCYVQHVLKGYRRPVGKGTHTCHILPPSEIDLGLCLAVFAGSGGKYVFHRIG